MNQKNISKLIALFSVLAVAVGAAGCGAVAENTQTPSTPAAQPDSGAAMTPSETPSTGTQTTEPGGTMTPPTTEPTTQPTTPPATTPPASNPPATTPPPANKSSYKDGTYTADGSYVSPGGTEGVTVTLTLKNDIVTDLKVVSDANDPMSARYQGMFISGVNAVVVGKNIDALAVTKVSGSSLTSGGFNQAVTRIKAEAKA